MNEEALSRKLEAASASRNSAAQYPSYPPPPAQNFLRPPPPLPRPNGKQPLQARPQFKIPSVDPEDDGAGAISPAARRQEASRIAALGPPVAPPPPLAPPPTTPAPASSSSLIAIGAASAAGLNDAQRRAATYSTDIALVIFAPAGAGKTLTLVHRVLHLIGAGGMQQSQVLSLTFTRKAAVEVRQRLQAMAAMDVEVATFHGWCLRLLRTFAHVIGRPADFRLASPSQQLGLLREAVAAWQSQQGSPSTPAVIGGGGRAGAPPATPAASGMTFVGSNSNAKRQHDATTALCKRLQRAMRDAKLLGASASAQTNALLMSDVGAFVTQHYDASLRRCGLVDLGDLQSIAVELLTKPEVRCVVQRRYKHALIDEYQDTNLQQLQIIKLLCEPPTPEGAQQQPNAAAAAPAEGDKPDRRGTHEGSRSQSRLGVLQQPSPSGPSRRRRSSKHRHHRSRSVRWGSPLSATTINRSTRSAALSPVCSTRLDGT